MMENMNGAAGAERTRLAQGNAASAPDLGEAARFLAILDESAERFEFRTFDDSEERKRSGTLRKELTQKHSGSLNDVAATLAELNSVGAGVYVVVNAGGQSGEEINRVRAVFADLDGTPLEPALACGIEPHVILESSPGRWHVYWLVDGLPPAEFKALQQAIIARLGSDKSVCDLPRVMRLPGFDHRKDGVHRVRIIHESGALPYTAERIRAAFPPAREPARPADVARSPTALALPSDKGNRYALAALANAVAKVASAPVGTRNDTLNREAFGVLQLAAAGAIDANEVRARLHRAALDSGLGEDEIASTLRSASGAAAQNPRSAAARVVDESRFSPEFMAGKFDKTVAHAPTVTPSGPALTPVDCTSLERAEVTPPRFVIEGIVPRRHVTMLSAHGGTGKSTLALALAAHVASGRGWGPFAVEQGRALFVSLEDEGDLVRWRLSQILEAYDLPPAGVAANLRIVDGTDCDGLVRECAAGGGARDLARLPALGELEALARDCALIVIDNASDAFTANANDPGLVRAFVRRLLGGIARANDAALLLLGHVDKHAARYGAAGQSFVGSAAWHNSARSRLALIESDGSLELVHEKSNLGAKAPTVALRFTDSGVLVPHAAGAARVGEAFLASADDDDLLAVMRTAKDQGVVVGTGRTGPSTAYTALQTVAGFPAAMHGPKGRKRFWSALGRLQSGGRVRVGETRTAGRHVRACLEVVAVP